MSSRVVLLFNPASGRGKAERFACALTAALNAEGWRVDAHNVADVVEGEFEDRLENRLNGARAIVLIGGDGTIHRMAPAIVRTGVPMLIAPMGTENLLARELGMCAEIDAVCSAIGEGSVSHIDMPTVNGMPFLVMCSVGLDAAIVAQVDANRTGNIRRSTYFKPALRQAIRPTLPALRITVDGEIVCDGLRGMLVVANCKRYGARLNPAKDASMTDGLLDVAFYPMRHTLDTLRWAALSWLGQQESARGFIKARGRMIEVDCLGDMPAPVQVDGNPWLGDVALPLRFVADAGRMAVLRV